MKTKAIVTMTLMAFILTGECLADELIRVNSSDSTNNASIIRHYDVGKDVVCIHSSQPYFIMLQEGNSITYALFVDMDTICDFEIHKDTVYFCGQKKTISGVYGAIGYFDIHLLYSPSTANVFYLYPPDIECINALEVDFFAGKKHVIAIGMDKNDSRIIDFIANSSYWGIYYGIPTTNSDSFSDLAITENYVVVTSLTNTGFSIQNYNGRLWYIEKPSYFGAALFYGTEHYCDIDYKITGKFFIKHRYEDEFVTACQKPTSTSELGEFCLSFYDGLSYIKSMLFNTSPITTKDINVLKDIVVGKSILPYVGNTVNVLLSGHIKTLLSPSYLNQSVIFEFPYGVWGYIATTGHVHYDIFLSTLDVSDGRHIVSSGYHSTYKTPTIDKMENGSYLGSCMNSVAVEMWYDNISHYHKIMDLYSPATHQTPETKESTRKKMEIETLCSYNTDNVQQNQK